MPKVTNLGSKLECSLVSWLAITSSFLILVSPSLNPLHEHSEATQPNLLIHCTYFVASLPALSIQDYVPVSHITSYWQHLPDLRHSVSVRCLQPPMSHFHAPPGVRPAPLYPHPEAQAWGRKHCGLPAHDSDSEHATSFSFCEPCF